MQILYFSFICLTFLLATTVAQTYPTTYTNSVPVDPPGGISGTFSWEFMNRGKTRIAMKYSVPVTGWVAIGISPENTDMTNSDMIVGRGSPFSAAHYWSSRQSTPTAITGETGLVARAGSTGGQNWVEWVRDVTVSGPQSQSLIPNAPTPIIFGYHRTSTAFTYHSGRATVPIEFFPPPPPPPPPPAAAPAPPSASPAPPSASPAPKSPAPGAEGYSFPEKYANKNELKEGVLTIEWQILGDTAIAIRLTRTGKGWMGIGFGATDDKMTKSDMQIGVIEGSVVVVRDYWSTSLSTPRLDTGLSGTNNVIKYQSSIVGDKVVAEFIRPLAATDANYDKAIVLPTVSLSYALGQDGETALAPHISGFACGGITVDLVTGSVTFAPLDPYKIAHAAAMLASWGLILLFGAIWARYARDAGFKIMDLPAWFAVHRVTQYTGFLISVAGFVLIIVKTQVHFTTLYHGQLGVAVMGLAVLQVIFAFTRAHPTPEGEKKPPIRLFFEYQHRITAFLLVTLSNVTIFAGFYHIGWQPVGSVIYGFYLFVVLVVVAILEVRKRSSRNDMV